MLIVTLYFLAPWLFRLALAQTAELCGKWSNYESTTLPYSFNNDAWAEDDSGYSCLLVHDDGASFSVKWQWIDNIYQVHAFPHLAIKPGTLPVKLSNLKSFHFKATWSTYITAAEYASEAASDAALTYNQVSSNVVLDMFLDADPTISLSSHTTYEVMFWLDTTTGINPVGWDTSNPLANQVTIGDTTYSLYYGNNNLGQTTYSWLPSQNHTSIDRDFTPLIQYLLDRDMIPPSVYLGVVNFGSEMFHSLSNTTFTAQDYTFDIVSNATKTSSTSTSTPTSTLAPTGESVAWTLRMTKAQWLGILLVSAFSAALL